MRRLRGGRENRRVTWDHTLFINIKVHVLLYKYSVTIQTHNDGIHTVYFMGTPAGALMRESAECFGKLSHFAREHTPRCLSRAR